MENARALFLPFNIIHIASLESSLLGVKIGELQSTEFSQVMHTLVGRILTQD